MSIKSDRWIRRMAREHNMIEPFVDSQVRQSDPQGRQVISYGVSSYGYDMRVAPEFKIFTNVLSAIVDPKAFDQRSFVPFEGDVCIVPPNSFALARSVEYFSNPPEVLKICVGKSTYARSGIITNRVDHQHILATDRFDYLFWGSDRNGEAVKGGSGEGS